MLHHDRQAHERVLLVDATVIRCHVEQLAVNAGRQAQISGSGYLAFGRPVLGTRMPGHLDRNGTHLQAVVDC